MNRATFFRVLLAVIVINQLALVVCVLQHEWVIREQRRLINTANAQIEFVASMKHRMHLSKP